MLIIFIESSSTYHIMTQSKHSTARTWTYQNSSSGGFDLTDIVIPQGAVLGPGQRQQMHLS